MLLQILKFIRLPILLLVIFAIARFSLGLAGVPYAPRGNAMFSVVVLTLVSSFYWGALSGKVGGFGWAGTALTGLLIGLVAQVLIFSATLISYAFNLQTYFVHWDALNVPEGTVVPMAEAMTRRAVALLTGPVTGMVVAFIGRALSVLAPGPANPWRSRF